MGRKSEGSPELVRVHIWMEKDQLEQLRVLFNDRVQFSQGIRTIVGAYLRRVRERADAEKRDVKVHLPVEDFV